MNFDRHGQTKTTRHQNSGFDLLGRIQSLPTVKKVYLYISLMAVVGAAMGALKYRVESVNCATNDKCWTVEPSQRKSRELGMRAVGGAIAATLISLPALLEDN